MLKIDRGELFGGRRNRIDFFELKCEEVPLANAFFIFGAKSCEFGIDRAQSGDALLHFCAKSEELPGCVEVATVAFWAEQRLRAVLARNFKAICE